MTKSRAIALTAFLAASVGGAVGIPVGIWIGGHKPPAPASTAITLPKTGPVPAMQPRPRTLALLKIYRKGHQVPDPEHMAGYMEGMRRADLAAEALAREDPDALALEQEMEKRAAARARSHEVDEMLANESGAAPVRRSQ